MIYVKIQPQGILGFGEHDFGNLTLPQKGQMSIYNIYFSNFGRPPVPDDLCKDSVPRHPRFWRRRFLKVFTIYGHGGLLGQWTATILAIFRSPNLRRLHMKFEFVLPPEMCCKWRLKSAWQISAVWSVFVQGRFSAGWCESLLGANVRG